jgi:4-hydroxy-4-methyl-2-oxoglutarate aldolase
MDRPVDPAESTRAEIDRTAADVLAAAKGLSSATLHEAAGKIGALPSAIKPVCPGFSICGPAVTVRSPPGDNLWLHRALYVAKPGDVLVITVAGAYEHGYWGEVMSTAAQAVGLGGMVIDGCVRDSVLLGQIGFPVFARGLCIRGTGKDFGARGWINDELLIGDVAVAPGDLVVGDADGVVAIPRTMAADAIRKSRERDDWEAGICRRLMAGDNTLDLFGWRR